MELDELKYQLNQKLATDHASRSNADLSVLLKKKTHSVISKLKRSLIIEMVLCITFFCSHALRLFHHKLLVCSLVFWCIYSTHRPNDICPLLSVSQNFHIE